MKKEDRFVKIHSEGSELGGMGKRVILVDRETGVAYLVLRSGYGLAVTPLLGADGRPVVGSKYFDEP